MNFKEILESDIAHFEEKQHQSLPHTQKDQSVKSDVDSRRNRLLGEIFIEYFPGAECFRPQLNRDANQNEYKQFADFLEKISKYKPVQNAWTQMIESKRKKAKAIVSDEVQDGKM